MWLFLGKALLAAVPKDKMLWTLLAIPAGIVIFIGVLFAGPTTFVKHFPVTNDVGYKIYIDGALAINKSTGLNINWQEIIAIDAVVLEQDFSNVALDRPNRYRSYFVEEKVVSIPCPSPSPSTSSTSKVTATPRASGPSATPIPQNCTRIEYSQRSLDQVLQMLVRDGTIKSSQIPDVKDYMRFNIYLSDESDGDHLSGGIQIGGDFSFEETDFAWPLPKANNRITSGFGTRIHPVTGERKSHLGMDIAANIGTDVYAIEAGVVSRVDYIGTGGNTVKIKHKNNIVSVYMHLNGYAVQEGDEVARGEVIAYSGNTGGSTGPHLHLQIEVNGSAINPIHFY